MVSNKKMKYLPLTATSIIGSTIFIITLSLLSSIVSYNVSKTVLYNRYQAQMTSIVNSVEGFIDHDDMYNCVQTQTESEKYKTAQYILDSLAEHYIDIHYIYILQPVDDARGAISVVSGNTQEDYNLGEDVHLGDGGEDWYSTEVANELKRIYAQDGDVFFYEDSAAWGRDYTLARPVKNSQGQKYGLLCVDISVDNIDKSVQQIVFYSLTIILSIGIFFILSLVGWMHIFIIRPIKKLQLSVAEYANKAHNLNDIDGLVFTAPDVVASREIGELYDSIEKVSSDMKNYVINMLEKEEEVQTLHSSIEKMDIVAYQDALTGVKNKAAFDRDIEVINARIASGEVPEFAVVMVDANDLKNINDNHGHDSGDIYLKGITKLVCDTFKHSPVYRFGGDEIVVILEDEDYQNREALVEELKKKFLKTSQDASSEKYQRYSAAVGMSIFNKDTDDQLYPVFRRADREMYANKAAMKKN